MTTARVDPVYPTARPRADRPTSAAQKFLFGGLGAETTLGDVGLLILRVSVGLYIAAHGWGKLHPAPGAWGPPEGFVGMTGGMGFTPPVLFAWLATLTEFAGGLLLALGLLTRWACVALIFNMGVAAFVAHADAPWVGTGEGPAKEQAMLYMFPFIAFLFMGAGRFSVDALLRRGGRRVDDAEVYVTQTPRAV